MNDVKSYFDEISDTWEGEKPSRVREVLEEFKLDKGMKILDIGCGQGIVLPYLYESNPEKIMEIDISKKMLEYNKRKHIDMKNVNYISGDFCEMDFKDYDFAIIFNAYPHFIDRRLLARKLSKALKKGAKLLIIHSKSRETINNIHSKNDLCISKELKEPLMEYEFFKDDFNILKTRDNDRYILYMIKK